MATESDVRDAIQTAMLGTNVFDPDGVFLFAPEDQGEGTDVTAAAWIEPIASALRDEWDAEPSGGIMTTVNLRITLAYRAEDPTARDRRTELLFNAACIALNGQVLIAGFTIPAWTRFTSWQWLPPASPERRIVAMFMYQYEIEGWNAFDVTNPPE